MARFMMDGRYHTWQSQEQNPLRIQDLDPNDPDRPQPEANNREDLLADLLNKQCRQLDFPGISSKMCFKEHVRVYSLSRNLTLLNI